MNKNRLQHNILHALLAVAVLCIAFAAVGCGSNAAHKTEADDFVYNVIEQKWDDQFGLKTNFKLDEGKTDRDPQEIIRAIPEDSILTLKEAVELATLNNREYQRQKEELYLRTLDLRLVRHLYDPNPFASSSAEYNKNNSRSGVGGEFAAGFEQLLATGGMISTKVALGWMNALSGDLEGGLTSILSAAVEIPLLRGSGREIALELLTQAERDVLYQIRAFNRYRKVFVVDTISRYYQILQLADKMNNIRSNYDNLKSFYDKASALKSAGKLPLHELEEINQDMLESLDSYVTAEKEYYQALDEFKVYLAIPPQAQFKLDQSAMESLRTFDLSELGFDEDEAIESAVAKRLDLANYTDSIIDAERKIKVAEDGLRPELNLVALAHDRRNSITEVRDSRRDYMIGAEMDLPWDRMEEKNEYREALINLDKAKRDQQEAIDMASLEVKNALRNLKESYQRNRVQTTSLSKAEKRVENTTLLLQYGRANTRDVLRAQRDLLNAKTQATDSLVEFMIATMEFYRDIGILEVKPDGMWQNETLAKKGG